MDEFGLIKRFFSPLQFVQDASNSDVRLAQGDDCAIVSNQAISVDTQVEGVHFLANMPADKIAYRGLAAALSDLAAMGAMPGFYTLALSLPDSTSEHWLEQYSKGLYSIAAQWPVTLIGGDTTRCDLLVQTFQVQGKLYSSPLTRSGARPGDLICVTGTLGDACAALEFIHAGKKAPDTFSRAYFEPQPRFDVASAIHTFATACIDISDGLLADLNHLCFSSAAGATIQLDSIPLSTEYQEWCDTQPDPFEAALTGGDDYQLCFTLPQQYADKISHLDATIIGEIRHEPGLTCLDRHGNPVIFKKQGYNHRTS